MKQYTFNQSVEHLKSSAVREILKLTQGKSIISFAGGLPAEELFPTDAVREAFSRVFEQGTGALQYGLTEGYLPLRQEIAVRLRQKNIVADTDDMLLTTGSQQAIDLFVRVYMDPGDVVLVEDPTYLAALQLFQFYGLRAVPVKSDEHGMDPDDLLAKIASFKPRMVYVVPTFANPTGNVWSTERRKALLDACKRHDILILEDDPYGEIQFQEGAVYPKLIALDDEPGSRNVVYTSTFSKTVAPALRTGWAVGPREVIVNMTRAKQASDLQSSTMDQQALYQLLAHFSLDEHISRIADNYKGRMEWMESLLKAHQWEGVRWNTPKGGMFFWLELPEAIDAEELLKRCVAKGVAFVPGAPFYAETPKRNTLRMNYTHSDKDTMLLGMNRFAEAVNETLVTK